MLKLWTLCVIVDKKHTKQARTKLKMFPENESIPVGQQGGLVLNISLKARSHTAVNVYAHNNRLN